LEGGRRQQAQFPHRPRRRQARPIRQAARQVHPGSRLQRRQAGQLQPALARALPDDSCPPRPDQGPVVQMTVGRRLPSACATTPTAPPTVDVTGKWAGDWSFENPRLGAGTLSGTLQQAGDKLSGTFTIIGGGGTVRYPSARIVGFVSGNEVRLSQPSSGTLTVNANELRGIINGLHAASVT